jgi:hypothetical protein
MSPNPFITYQAGLGRPATGALTRDKPLLSGPTTGTDEMSTVAFAINCTALANPHTVENIDGFVRDSLSENSRRAYASDLAQFLVCGDNYDGRLSGNYEGR